MSCETLVRCSVPIAIAAFCISLTNSIFAQSTSKRDVGEREFGCLSTVQEIEQALATLDQGQLDYLQRQRDKFAALSARERQQLRRTHESLMTADDPEKLYALLKRYREWLASLSATERAQILKLDPQDRIEAIKKKLGAAALPALRGMAELRPEDARAFMKWLGEFVNQHDDKIIEMLPERARAHLRGMPASPRRTMKMATLLFETQPDLSDMPGTGEQSFKRLFQSLSPGGKAQLREAMQEGAAWDLLRQWVTAIRMRQGAATISRERMEQFYENDLSPADRDYIDSLPPEQVDQEIRRLIFERRSGRRS